MDDAFKAELVLARGHWNTGRYPNWLLFLLIVIHVPNFVTN
jgi:hypothetical protein